MPAQVGQTGNSQAWRVTGHRGVEEAQAAALQAAAATAAPAVKAAAAVSGSAEGGGPSRVEAAAFATGFEAAAVPTGNQDAAAVVSSSGPPGFPAAPMLRLLNAPAVFLDTVLVLGTLLGKGSYGFVRQALHKSADVQVAAKVFYEGAGRMQWDVALHEAYVAEQCRGHPNLARILDAFLHFLPGPGRKFAPVLVYELWGRSLADELRAREAPLPAAALRSALSGVLNGVKHLHGLRLLHTDIKPANILVVEVVGAAALHAKLADVGCVVEARVTPRGVLPVVFFSGGLLWAGGGGLAWRGRAVLCMFA